MGNSKGKSQKRFDRKTRRSMILDSAAELIAEEGVAQLSLESIGQKANVSKTLMYRYFGSQIELLRELLDREYDSLRDQQAVAAENAETYEDLVRNVTRAYLSYIEERGLIIEKLQAYPNISNKQDPTHYRREAAVSYLAKLVSDSFDIPMDMAIACTDISFGLPASAGDFLLRSKMDRQKIEDLTVAMMMGGMMGVRYDVSVAGAKLKRPTLPKKKGG
ncbi:MAG: TetR/AcrR family transcriptional regulator [Parasphingorhabdus sp.]|uniref:TetR/AcrR family transcriptional regulator n=2 Tax=Parasphingorhabdus sp. TaxID=2709688 RepID=UPI003267EA0E